MFKKLHILDIHNLNGNILGTGLDCTVWVLCLKWDTIWDQSEPVFIFFISVVAALWEHFCHRYVSNSRKSVHTSTWSFKYTYTGKEGQGEVGGQRRGSTEKHWRGNWHQGEEEEEKKVHNGEQRCFLFFFWVLTAASRRFDPHSWFLCRLRSLRRPRGGR